MPRTDMRLYIDTYGHNRGIWRNAGSQARFAAHLPTGATLEFVVQADGRWAVNEGDAQRGGYEQVAAGIYRAGLTSHADIPRRSDP